MRQSSLGIDLNYVNRIGNKRYKNVHVTSRISTMNQVRKEEGYAVLVVLDSELLVCVELRRVRLAHEAPHGQVVQKHLVPVVVVHCMNKRLSFLLRQLDGSRREEISKVRVVE